MQKKYAGQLKERLCRNLFTITEYTDAKHIAGVFDGGTEVARTTIYAFENDSVKHSLPYTPLCRLQLLALHKSTHVSIPSTNGNISTGTAFFMQYPASTSTARFSPSVTGLQET